MTKKFLTGKAQQRFLCSECGVKVPASDYNKKYKNCKWCAFRHTKTWKQRESVRAFSLFCERNERRCK